MSNEPNQHGNGFTPDALRVIYPEPHPAIADPKWAAHHAKMEAQRGKRRQRRGRGEFGQVRKRRA